MATEIDFVYFSFTPRSWLHQCVKTESESDGIWNLVRQLSWDELRLSVMVVIAVDPVFTADDTDLNQALISAGNCMK